MVGKKKVKEKIFLLYNTFKRSAREEFVSYSEILAIGIIITMDNLVFMKLGEILRFGIYIALY